MVLESVREEIEGYRADIPAGGALYPMSPARAG
jgi:hypothetical protein